MTTGKTLKTAWEVVVVVVDLTHLVEVASNSHFILKEGSLAVVVAFLVVVSVDFISEAFQIICLVACDFFTKKRELKTEDTNPI